MARLFKRDYSITIKSADGRNKIITGLRIDFEIIRSLLSFPNTCKIDIFNCNDDTLGRLRDKFTRLQINLGYVDDIGLVFTGDVRNVFQQRVPPDNIVTVYAGDAQQTWQNSRINRTFKPGTELIDVIQQIAQTFNLGEPEIIGDFGKFAPLGGQTVSGASKTILDTLALDLGFDWSVQNNSLLILAKTENLGSTGENVVINSNSGLLGSPTITELGADVTTRLNHRVTPGGLIKIESVNAEVAIGNLEQRELRRTSAEGTYKVQQVTFKGSTRRDGKGPWQSQIIGASL